MRINMSVARATMVVAGILSLVLVATSAPSRPAQSSGDAPKTAEQVNKNIQVLKGMPADQLIPAMQFISNSLNVECEQEAQRDGPQNDPDAVRYQQGKLQRRA